MAASAIKNESLVNMETQLEEKGTKLEEVSKKLKELEERSAQVEEELTQKLHQSHKEMALKE